MTPKKNCNFSSAISLHSAYAR